MILDMIRNNSIICIDIGYRNIKVVQVNVKKKTEVTIEGYGMTTTPYGVIKNGAISDVPKVTEEIKNVIKYNKLSAKNAKIIMSGTNIITRIYLIDKVEGESYEKTIIKTMPKYLPVNLDEYRVDYKILQIIKEDEVEKYKVFITAVPSKILKSYLEVLQGLNLKPLAVDIPANSAAKFFRRDIKVTKFEEMYRKKGLLDKIEANQDTFAVIDFGSETTVVNFMKDKVLEFNKVILAGSSNIDDIIAKNMGISLNDSEKLKKLYGLIPPKSKTDKEHILANKYIRGFADDLLRQIVKCFEFYLDRLYGHPISRIYVVGGGSQLRGLQQFLVAIFKVPVYPVTVLDLEGFKSSDKVDKSNLIYMINSVGISL